MKRNKEKVELNPALVNIIAPQGLTFRKNSFDIGENIVKAYGIIRYPQSPKYGWLSDITTIPGTLFSLQYTPSIDGTMLENVNSNIAHNKQRIGEAKGEWEKQKAETAVESGRMLLERAGIQEESIGEAGIVIMPVAKDEAALERAEKKMKALCSTGKLKPRLLAHKQKVAFKNLSPTHIPERDVSMIIDRPMELRTVVGGFPFSTSGLNDGSGYYFAIDNKGNIVIINPWLRAGDRTNTNFFIEGVPGVGKTTAVKSLIISEYMKGNHIIIFDPQGEYKELTEKVTYSHHLNTNVF